MESFKTIAELSSERMIYFRFDPNISDFTKKYEGKFIIQTPTRSVSFTAEELSLNTTPASFYHLLNYTVFSENHITLTWDIKKFCSWIVYHTKMNPRLPKSQVIDLKYSLSYQGCRVNKAPNSFDEALKLAKLIATEKSYKQINEKIFAPLAFEALPTIENIGFVDTLRKEVLYPYYEIEGQLNGRLSAKKPSDKFLSAHTLDPKQKARLKPRKYLSNDNWRFALLDFQHMEVSILAWLSGDEELQKSLNSDDEFYSSIITEDIEGWDRRKLGKSLFLPIVFGLQAKNLADRLKISFDQADLFVSSIRDRFKQSFDWIENEVDLNSGAFSSDYFGRKRDFTDVPKYKIRNFKVQSPASLICLERLCCLCKELYEYVSLHIHDGYVLTCPLKDCPDIIKKAQQILTSESKIAPGLKLSVSCQIGETLNKLHPIFFKGK